VIDSKFHVEINGKKYTLAEDAEGAHYQWRREPLRAPTNGFVLGDTGKFNLRPDLLQWNLTDWSGGEGYLVFDNEESNTYNISHRLDPSVPGELRLAKAVVVLNDSTGSAQMDESGTIETAREDLFFIIDNSAIGGNNDGILTWDKANLRWGARDSDALAPLGPTSVTRSAGNARYVFFGADDAGGSMRLIRYDGTDFTVFGSETSWEALEVGGPIKGQMYVLGTNSGDLFFQVLEFDLTDTPVATGTVLYTSGDGVVDTTAFSPKAAVGPNRLYFSALIQPNTSALYEVTPTTAAAPGFVEEVYRSNGLQIETLFYLAGFIFILGQFKGKTAIFYFDTVERTIGVVYTQPESRVFVSPGTSVFFDFPIAAAYDGSQEGFTAHFLHASGPTEDGTEISFMTLNALTGAVYGGPVWSAGTQSGGFPQAYLVSSSGVIVFNGGLFAAVRYNTSGPTILNRTLRVTDNYDTVMGYLDSTINDFGLVDEKVLMSFTLITEKLPAGNTVVIKYQLDQNDVWLIAGTMSTTGATEETFLVSTDSTTRTFRNLQIRIELDSDSGSETPVVRSVRALATVVQGVKLWSLILNASDELGAMQNRAWDGATLIENITTAASNNAVVAFKDGYTNRKPGSYREYDVVIDDVTVVNDRPGEGTIQVTLREVI